MSYVKRRRVLTEGYVRRTITEVSVHDDVPLPKVEKRKLNPKEQEWSADAMRRYKGDQRGAYKVGQAVKYKGKTLFVAEAHAEMKAPDSTLYTLVDKDHEYAYDNVQTTDIEGKKSHGRARKPSRSSMRRAGSPFRMF